MNPNELIEGCTISSTLIGKEIPASLAKLGLVFAQPSSEKGGNLKVLHHSTVNLFDRNQIGQYIGDNSFDLHRVDSEWLKELTSKETETEEDFSDVQKLFKEIFDESVKQNASDIHIYSYPTDPNIKFRVNGELEKYQHHSPLSRSQIVALGKCIFMSETGDTGSNKNSYCPDKTQSATVTERVGANGHRYRLRYQDAALNGDVDVVHTSLRLLDIDKDFTDGNLLELGYASDQQAVIYDGMLKGGGGLVIIVGATGDGKTTTAATILGKLAATHRGRKQIITIEDPVEFNIPGVEHTQVSVIDGEESESEAWERHLKAILRRDPDFILQGEMRTESTAKSAAHTALTGHTTVCTLHGNSAFDAYVRLQELNLPLSLLSSDGFIKGIIYQRLLPKLCGHCSHKMNDYAPDYQALVDQGIATSSLVNRLVQNYGYHLDHVQFRNEEGCDHCNKGLVGREAVCETMIPDSTIREHVNNGAIDKAKKAWIDAAGQSFILSEGDSLDSLVKNHVVGFTAFHHAVEKMLHGVVSPVDVEDKLALLSSVRVHLDGSFTGDEVETFIGHATPPVAKAC